MSLMRRLAPLFIGLLVLVTACQSGGGELLDTIKSKGKIVVATDPAYPPQSELLSDGTFEGFDIDVANEIGKRLGVSVEFATPQFAEVEAGGWAGRFDISVGSMTITETRSSVLDFTPAYYYTPAQIGATTASGITTLEGMAGKTICVGESTTYQFWLEGTLSLLGGAPSPGPVPEGAQVTTFSTDSECADAIAAGRTDFEGWLTSITTLEGSIEAGAEFIPVGEPVFYEPLGIAMDKASPVHAKLQAELDRIVAEMHDDGTLAELSDKWFGVDYTTAQ